MAGREARLLQAESPAQWRRLAVRGLDVDGNVARDASDHVHQQLSAAGAAGEHLDSCGGERRPRLGEIYIFNIFFLLRFYVPAGFICYIVACLRCLWATAELQESWLRGLSFQMGNFCFLPGTRYLLLIIGTRSTVRIRRIYMQLRAPGRGADASVQTLAKGCSCHLPGYYSRMARGGQTGRDMWEVRRLIVGSQGAPRCLLTSNAHACPTEVLPT